MNPFQSVQQRFSRLSGRSRAVGMFFATSLASRAVGILAQLLMVPIVVKALGAEAFGLWMTLMGFSFLIMYADLGVGQGVQNQLAEDFARGRTAAALDLFGNALKFLGLMALGLAALVLLFVGTVDFTRLFNLVNPAVQHEASGAVAVMMLLFCLNFPFGLAQRLAYSRQQGWMHNFAQAAGGVGSLGGVLISSHWHWSLPGVIAAAQAPTVLANGILLVVQLTQLKWLSVYQVKFRPAVIRSLLKLGAYFGFQQILLTVLIAMPQVFISTYLGAAAVTPFNLAQRLFNLFAIPQNAFMLPLWPAYSDAQARGDYSWIKRTLGLSLLATTGTVAVMALGAWFARPIITLWVGGTANLPSVDLVWLLFAWNALVFFQQPFSYLLSGMSHVRRLTFYGGVSVALSVCLMFLLAGRQQEGIVLGVVIGYLPLLLVGNIVETIGLVRSFPAREQRHREAELANAPQTAESSG